MTDKSPIWEEPERVEEFAKRDADVRLMELVDRYRAPSTVCILDLGCAGGAVTLSPRRGDPSQLRVEASDRAVPGGATA